jgi:DNA-binding transcriptional regulator YbjK
MNSETLPTTGAQEFESLKSSIQYQGRKAARAKSEYRRKEILDAALRIVAREGIRGVKHRAVAKEAGVPLASTTYYFKDIEELISDAFMLFAEKSLRVLDIFYGELNKLVSSFDVKQIHSDPAVKEKFAYLLVDMGVGYIESQVKFRKEDVLTEMAFLLEAVRDERLKPLARDYRGIWYSRLIDFLITVNAPAPKEDAMLIISSVQGLLYEGIVNDGKINEVKTRAILKRAIFVLMQR